MKKYTIFAAAIAMLIYPAVAISDSMSVGQSTLLPPTGLRQDDPTPMPEDPMRYTIRGDHHPGVNRPHRPRPHKPATPTPIPGALLLLGTGLAGLFWVKRKIK